jgi:uncharacterized membrane protein YcfT
MKNPTQASFFTPAHSASARRVDWADYAKGFCIIMVVMMHSTLGVGEAVGREGFMHVLVAFAKPFRMPDFFMISGLFLSRVIDRDWRTYLDRKVVHFAYFYVLWVTIQFAVKAPVFAAAHGWTYVFEQYALAFIEPFGTLWFIYLLPIFFVVTKATRSLPPAAVWCVAAAMQVATIQTGWTTIDEFTGRFVYFYTGYLLAPQIFTFAALVQARSRRAMVGLLAWALVNGGLVYAGVAGWPVISLALGLAGASAVIAVSALMARAHVFGPVRYCGEHSIVIYLAFFLPMAATRTLLLKTGLVADVGVMSLIVTTAGVIGALAMWWAVRGTALKFLFERPDAFWIAPRQPVAVPAARSFARGAATDRAAVREPGIAAAPARASRPRFWDWGKVRSGE